MEIMDLASALRLSVGALHKKLRKQSNATQQYSMTEIETVGCLHRHKQLLPTELAALTRITTQSMSQILSKMEKMDLIQRKAADDDKRKTYISLTARGKKMVNETFYERDEWLKTEIENALTKKEIQLLEKSLLILQKLLKIDNNGMV